MYRSYIKTGVRNFKKHKGPSFINVFGLATTIAIALIVYVMIDREFSLDKFHSEADKVFAVQSNITWNGSEETWGRAPLMIGPALKGDYPQVEQMTRVDVKPAIVRFEDRVFTERLTFADPEYLEIFRFPLLSGTKRALENKSSVILSSGMAEKYFRGKDPIGKDIKLIIDNQTHLLSVAAVAAEFPDNASFEFQFLTTFNNLEQMFDVDLNGSKNIQNESVFTFIKLDQAEHIEQVMAGTDKYRDVLNEANKDWPIQRFKHHELPTLARNAQYIREAYASGSTPEIMIMFGIISLLLLVSACFNYVNIAVSMAQKRLNEIALRKVVGGQRKQLITQFLTENLVLCFIATIIGMFIAIYILLPGINALFLGSDYRIQFLQNPSLGIFLFGLFIVLGLASGAYPAFYISSFKPVSILKGKEKLTSKNRLTKFFLTSQFLLTFLAIVSGLLFTSINEVQQEQSWGYNPDDLLVLPVDNKEQFDAMRLWATQSPRIKGFSGSEAQIGLSGTQQVIRILEDKFTVRSFPVGAGYLNTLGLELFEGRDFDHNLSSDESSSIIVNEQFITKMGLTASSIEDQLIDIDGSNFNIIGVVRDFHFDDFFSPITPAIIRLVPDERFAYINMKTVAGGGVETEAIVRQQWSEQFPDSPYAGFFQDEVFDNFFQSTGALKSIMNFVAFVAIVLSSMGLFGLVSLLIIKKLKEYSIRKVLGAQSVHVVKLISGQFLVMLIIALSIGIPASYFLFDMLFEQMFPGTLDSVTMLPFLISIFVLCGVILVTITSHILQLIRMNPVNSLRLEN